MNFSQWKNYAAKNDVSKITYCCGEQTTLVELVLEDIKSILAVSATDFITLDANQDIPVWEIASQYSLDPKANRLIVVRNAEKFNDWQQLESWLANSRVNPKNFLVFVSEESDAPAVFAKGKKVEYAEHIELIRTKGKFIKCSTPNDDDLVAWAQSYGLSKMSAQFVVERTSGNVSSMLNIFRKIDVWDGSPTPKALALLCEEEALDSFVDYLILRDKKSAYLALANLDEMEKSKILAKLDYRLDSLVEIGRCVRRRMFDGDIAASTGIKVYIVKRFKAVTKDYDDNKIRYCRQLLTVVDGALKDGVKVGAWETLISLW